MNISEAAKKAAEEVWKRDNSAYLDVFARGAEMRIQSAIDAETAAKDAEIARLKDEVAQTTENLGICNTSRNDLIDDKAELVEALKKAKGLFSKPDEPMQKFPNWAQAILVIDAALKKAGAE